MFRLLGFLIGSLTSIVIILLIIGMPRFNLNDQDSDQERYDAAIEKLRAKQQEIESVTGRLSEDVARVARTVDDDNEIVLPADVPDEPPEMTASTEVMTVPVPDDELSWYSFWNPFRSELAANGFVSQLEKVTGLDYRVVKVKSGVYEVAFAYHDDEERKTKLSQISLATGLELPDS